MTLIEVRNQIVGHFMHHDMFVIPTDLDKITVNKTQEAVKLELVKLAFAELKEAKFCQAILSEDSTKAIYILEQPIFANGQNIKISMPTANAVAEIVNLYAEQLGNEEMITDKMNIQDKDVQFLCIIINDLLEAQPTEASE